MPNNQPRPGNDHVEHAAKHAILGERAYGLNKVNNRGMVDVSHKWAGQNGYQTDFRGYVNNASYVKRNLICVLIAAPTGFQHLPSPGDWVSTLKALVEVQAQNIEGLNATITAEFTDTPVGGSGEMQQDIQDVKRERSVPSFTWIEKYGMPINAFLNGWITGLIMDPITKVPGVMSSTANLPQDLLPDYTGATMLFLEPDPTHSRVVKAWLCTNMHPKSAGDVIGIRDITSGGDVLTYNIEFTALTQVGHGVDMLAQTYLSNMSLAGVNPNTKPAFTHLGVDTDVNSVDSGYSDQVKTAQGDSYADNMAGLF